MKAYISSYFIQVPHHFWQLEVTSWGWAVPSSGQVEFSCVKLWLHLNQQIKKIDLIKLIDLIRLVDLIGLIDWSDWLIDQTDWFNQTDWLINLGSAKLFQPLLENNVFDLKLFWYFFRVGGWELIIRLRLSSIAIAIAYWNWAWQNK